MFQQVAPHLPPAPGFHRPAAGRLLWSGGAQQRTSGREAHNARAFSFPDSSLRGLSGQLLCSRRRLCAALSPVGVALLPPLSSPWACRGHSWSFCTTLARPTPHIGSPYAPPTGLGANPFVGKLSWNYPHWAGPSAPSWAPDVCTGHRPWRVRQALHPTGRK